MYTETQRAHFGRIGRRSAGAHACSRMIGLFGRYGRSLGGRRWVGAAAVACGCRAGDRVPRGVPLPGQAPAGSAGDERWQECLSPTVCDQP